MSLARLAHLRVEFYKAIEPLSPARLVSMRSGDLPSRVIDDIENLQNLHLRAVAPPLVAVVLALLLTVFLNLFNPLIAFTALIFMLAAGILVPLLAWWGNEKSGEQHVTVRAELKANMVDHIQGMAEMLVYGQIEAQFQKIQSLSQQLVIEDQHSARFDALQLAFSVFFDERRCSYRPDGCHSTN